MNFQCKNCGGNMVFAPEKQKMYCPFCDGTDCEEIKGDDSLVRCPSCGGEIELNKFTSAARCGFCNNYIVFDKRVTGDYEPDSILPFLVSKAEAVKCMEKEFKKRTYAPVSFLHEKTLKGMSGFYVPFFLYDYSVDADFTGEGTKVRTWTSGNYDYTETSYYDIIRRMHVDYDNVPADASDAMDDSKMDLMEPYDYRCLMEFNPKYLSGFFGEVYNQSASDLEPRAKYKVLDSAQTLLNKSMSGYSSIRTHSKNVNIQNGKVDYTLLPVWLYIYEYGGKQYRFYVNGQSGKVIGKTPISKLKVLLYSLTSAGLFTIIAFMILKIWEVL